MSFAKLSDDKQFVGKNVLLLDENELDDQEARSSREFRSTVKEPRNVGLDGDERCLTPTLSPLGTLMNTITFNPAVDNKSFMPGEPRRASRSPIQSNRSSNSNTQGPNQITPWGIMNNFNPGVLLDQQATPKPSVFGLMNDPLPNGTAQSPSMATNQTTLKHITREQYTKHASDGFVSGRNDDWSKVHAQSIATIQASQKQG